MNRKTIKESKNSTRTSLVQTQRMCAMIAALLALASLAGSCDIFKTLDNPADPLSPNFQGYIEVAETADVAAMAPAGSLQFPPSLKGSKIIGGDRYRFQISVDAAFSVPDYDREQASNILETADWLPGKGPGTYYFRLMAHKGGNWGPWSKGQQFVLKSEGTVAAPAIAPPGGDYSSPQMLTIKTNTEGAQIRYTTDGNAPALKSGTLYADSFEVTATTTVKAQAFKPGWQASAVTSEQYDIDLVAAEPVFSPVPGVYTEALQVSLATGTAGASIRYTTDGNEPSSTTGTLYSGAFTVAATTTIKAIACKTGWGDSAVVSGTYTITGTVAAPVFSPDGGTYTSARNVSISCATAGSTIRYTKDHSSPSSTWGTIYTGTPISVTQDTTLKAIAYKTDWNDSPETVASYVITGTVPTPTFSLASGTYTASQNVSISCSLSDVVIYFTTNGSDPTRETGTLYEGGNVPIASSCVLKAKAWKTGWLDSAIGSATYTITGTVAAPTFSPAAGTYTSAQSVTISCTLNGAFIRYTVNGSSPTPTSGTIYTTPVSISSTSTIRAIAYKADWFDSSVAQATYTITGTVPTPSFSPEAGPYTASQNVTISCSLAGTTIRYTTDGSAPSQSHGTVYSGPVIVNTTRTLKAIAYKAGWDDSAVASGEYIISGTIATPTFSPAPGTYTSAQNVSISCLLSGATIRYTTNGDNPSQTVGTVYQTPVPISGTTTLKAIAYKTSWLDSNIATGLYTITGTVSAPTFSPAAGTYTSAQSVSLSAIPGGSTIIYTTDNSTPTATNGATYTSPISVSANTTIKAFARKTDWLDSDVSSAAYTITGKVAAPTFSPGGGTYVTGKSVIMNSTTTGATIRYTTNGDTPTRTTGAVYSTPVSVPSTKTLKAIAYKTDWLDSDVTTADYEITGLDMVEVQGGIFMMGSAGAYTSDATPVHEVGVSTFFMGKHELTQAEYEDVMASNPSAHKNSQFPVDNVSWYDAVEFCNALSRKEGKTPVYTVDGTNVTIDMSRNGYRLPTEAEWGFAARGGNFSNGYKYAGSNTLSEVAWYGEGYYSNPHPVEQKSPNELGLYDMGGNILEWCQDWYASSFEAGPQTDPSGPSTGTARVLSGASCWHGATEHELQKYRFNTGPDTKSWANGFRVVCRPDSGTVGAPYFSPAAGNYAAHQTVAIRSTTANAAIRYTTDGSTPTTSHGTLYTGVITITGSASFRAIAYRTGWTTSDVTQADFTLPETVAAPVFSPGAGTFAGPQTVSITTTTPGATIRYTTDGSDPSSSAGTVYSAAITIAAPTTLKAIAYRSGWFSSSITSGLFTMPETVATPTFTPAAGTYFVGKSVSIRTGTSGATIRYTTDGSTPTKTYGTVYSSPVSVTSTKTLKAIAYKTSWLDSAVATADYEITGLDMVLVEGGTFMMGSTINHSGDTIPVHQVAVSSYYIGRYEVTQAQYNELMGTNPSTFFNAVDAATRPVEMVDWYKAVSFCNALSTKEGKSPVYLIEGTTVTADMTKNGYRLPTEAEWEYAARGGSYSNGYAYAGSDTPGDVAWYGVNSGNQTHSIGGKAPNELDLYDMSGNVREWCQDWYGAFTATAQVDPVGPGAGDYRLVRGGGNQSDIFNIHTSACRVWWGPQTTSQEGGFRVVRRPDSGTVGAPYFSPVAGSYATHQTVAIRSPTAYATIRYTTDGSTPTTSHGTVYTDPITITGSTSFKAIAYRTGWTASGVTQAEYTLPETVVAPVFSPAAGSYAGYQTVSITTTTPGASIRYTTDGSDPSASAGTLYSSAISITATTTLKAIAYRSGWFSSSVTSGLFSMPDTVATPTFSPTGGTSLKSKSVIIRTTTSGATIRYTTNGDTPTSTTGSVYSTPISVTSTKTLKAIAFKSGWIDSAMATAEYIIPGLDMVAVEGGTFQMGSLNWTLEYTSPVHTVTLSSFSIGKYEITQAQYEELMMSNPSNFKNRTDSPLRPVENVSWYDAVSFCNALSTVRGKSPVYTIDGTNVTVDMTKDGYRLPTEAEWEYAARGGLYSQNYGFAGSDTAGDVAWYSMNAGSETHPCGEREPNELGIHDMSGNVWEWCQDRYGVYGIGPFENPEGPATGGNRVLRGGSYGDGTEYLYTARCRTYSASYSYGFRIVCRP